VPSHPCGADVKIICYSFCIYETTQEINVFLGNLVLGILSNICQHILILVKLESNKRDFT
jgi:hypothetical protein